MSLARFLRLVEEMGDAAIHAHTLVERVGAATFSDLVAARLVVPAGVRHDYHCGGVGDGCRRTVSAVSRGGELPLLASCGRVPAACAPIRLSRADAKAFRAAVGEIEAIVGALFELTPATGEDGGDDEAGIARLGDQPRRHRFSREVFLAWRPGDPGFAIFLAKRTRLKRRALVLVPTTQDVSTEVVLRYARGRRIQIGVLSELLGLREGALVRRRRETIPKLPRKRRTLAELFLSTKRALPTLSEWGDAAFHRPDSDRLLLRTGGSEIAVTPVDLGMAFANGEPKLVFNLLLHVCDQQGWFCPNSVYGDDKMRMVRLRKRLQLAFGLTGDPFFEHRRRFGWRARFGATSDPSRARPVRLEDARIPAE